MGVPAPFRVPGSVEIVGKRVLERVKWVSKGQSSAAVSGFGRRSGVWVVV